MSVIGQMPCGRQARYARTNYCNLHMRSGITQQMNKRCRDACQRNTSWGKITPTKPPTVREASQQNWCRALPLQSAQSTSMTNCQSVCCNNSLHTRCSMQIFILPAGCLFGCQRSFNCGNQVLVIGPDAAFIIADQLAIAINQIFIKIPSGFLAAVFLQRRK